MRRKAGSIRLPAKPWLKKAAENAEAVAALVAKPRVKADLGNRIPIGDHGTLARATTRKCAIL